MSPDVTEYAKTILHRVGSSRGTAVAGAGSAETLLVQADTALSSLIHNVTAHESKQQLTTTETHGTASDQLQMLIPILRQQHTDERLVHSTDKVCSTCFVSISFVYIIVTFVMGRYVLLSS